MQDLYNRIRPREFSQMLPTSNFLKGIDEIVQATIDGKPGLPHVMIFHSAFIPGLGKTTCARILCVSLNPKVSDLEADSIFKGLPSMICNEVNATDMKKPDIAALISNMMSAREDIYGYNYIYIINEAHKLTEDSVQLLLSVEDLPDNVYVIMTTTETVKIRNDLLSRIRTYTFKPVSDDIMKGYLINLINTYKDEYPYSSKYDLTVDVSRIQEIIAMSDTSIRKAVVLLEQYMTMGEIDKPNDVDQDEKDKYKVFFSDFLKTWVNILLPGGNTSWKDIAKMYNSISTSRNGRAGMPAEEFRKHIIFRIQNRITSDYAVTDGLVLEESVVYSILERYILDMLTFPVSTQLILKLHMAYMDIIFYKFANVSGGGNDI